MGGEVILGGSPHTEDYSILGSILGSLYLGRKLPYVFGVMQLPETTKIFLLY